MRILERSARFRLERPITESPETIGSLKKKKEDQGKVNNQGQGGYSYHYSKGGLTKPATEIFCQNPYLKGDKRGLEGLLRISRQSRKLCRNLLIKFKRIA